MVKTMKGDDEQSRSQWFLKDDPVSDLTEQDYFGHRAYSEVLADAVLNAVPPFTIGVFGEWGVGKTTMSKEFLAQALERKAKGKVAFVYFDVWKYEEDSLRRQFLRDVATQLSKAKQLKSYRPERELRDLVEDISETAERGLRFSWERLVAAIPIALVFGVLAYVALRVGEKWIEIESTREQFVLSLLVAVAVAVAREAGRIIVIGEREVTRKSIDAPDLFEEKFRQIMDHVKAERVLIVIDNLDRCTPDRVVEVLSTIKTFLEPSGARKQPVFVIPCDRAAIRRHLMAGEEVTKADAEEYLRKFFNAALPINPILEEEIRSYVADEIEGLEVRKELDEEHLRELTQVIGVAFRHNPRRVKQFLNTLTAKLMLIRQREKDGNIDPPISQEVPFLAKLTVIEEEWPRFYEVVSEDVRAFDQLSQAAVGLPGELSSRIEQCDTPELRDFLRGTRRTRSTNIRAFTRLKQAPIELKLPDYEEFRNALIDARLEPVAQMVHEATEDALAGYREALISILKSESDNGYFESAINVIDTAIHTEKLLSQDVAIEVVERLYSVEQIRALIPSLAPFETFRVLGLADSDASSMLTGQYLELVRESDLQPLVSNEDLPAWQTQVARGLMSVRQRLKASDVKSIRTVASGPLATNIEFLRELAVAEDGPEQFLASNAFETAVGGIEAEDLTLDDGGALKEAPATQIVLKSLNMAQQQGISLLLQKAETLLSQMPSDPAASGREGLMQLLMLSRYKLEAGDQAAAASLGDALRGQYSYTSPHSRWKVISVLSALYPLLTTTAQTEVQNLFGQFVTSEPLVGTGVGIFVAVEAQRGLNQLAEPLLTALLAQLKERFRTSGSPSDASAIAAIFITYADQIEKDQLQNLFLEAIDANAPRPVINALTEHKRDLVEKHEDVLLVILTRVLDTLSAYPPAAVSEPYEIIWILSDLVDDEIRKRVRDHLVSVLSRTEPASREVGLQVLEDAERNQVIRDSERRHIVEQVVVWIVGQIDVLDTSIGPLLSRVARDIPIAEEATQDNAVNALKALLPKDPSLRDMAAEYLVQVTPESRRAEIVEELIHRAKQETEVARRGNLVRRARDLAGDRRTKARRTLDDYLGTLRESPEEDDRTLAEDLLRS